MFDDECVDLLPTIAFTSGEPAGIGPDIILTVLAQSQPARIMVFADPAVLQDRADILGLSITIIECDVEQPWPAHQAGVICVSPIHVDAPVVAGQLNVNNANYVLETLRLATQACFSGQAQALVTPPLHKGIINDAGVAFSGHTEYLAEQTGGHHPVMLLMTEGLRVALATTHLPLSQVSKAITEETLTKVLQVLHADLKRLFGIENPCIYVCGLNPHAGEGGHLGYEEIDVIIPTLDKLRQQNMHLVGPLPADTLFSPKNLQQADAVLAMYHDQGLPVLKFKGFGQAINVTLGLPIIRTSVDHGTALDLAGKGEASADSLQLALSSAIDMARQVGSCK